MSTKQWYKSKMLWFNVVFTIADVALFLTELVPDKYVIYAITVQGIANIVLRVWFTDKKLELTADKK